MRNMKKYAAMLVLTMCALFTLSACGGSAEEEATKLVQGNIDMIYLGKYDSEYLEMVDTSESEAEAAYREGLEVEAEYFTYYWGIVDTSYGESYTDLDESFRNKIVDLYEEIYSHSKYEVQTAVKQDDGSFTVRVLVDPIDIMEQAYNLYQNDEYAPLNEFWDKYAETDFSTMSDEDYMAYTHEYGEIIVQMVKDQLPNLGYMDQKSQSIQVQEVDGYQTINDDDWWVFDSYVIYYP